VTVDLACFKNGMVTRQGGFDLVGVEMSGLALLVLYEFHLQLNE